MNGNQAVNVQQQMHSDTIVNYVNVRQGKRPASLKCSDGRYYTISDTATDLYQQFIGTQVALVFTQNSKGYFHLVSLNGEAMPRDPRPGMAHDAQRPPPPPQQSATVQHLPVNPTPQVVPAPASAGPARTDVPPGICGILKSAIEAGLPREEAMKWVKLGLGQDPLGGDEIPF